MMKRTFKNFSILLLCLSTTFFSVANITTGASKHSNHSVHHAAQHQNVIVPLHDSTRPPENT